jgi:ribosomal-protein-alanine N-acetyltransferase
VSNVTLRAARLADYDDFARLFAELAVPEKVPSAERFAEAIAPDASIAEVGGAVVGYAWGRLRGERFHVVHLVVDPLHRGRGVGRALMDGMAARARTAGLRRWMLNVKPENVAARALYERCGLRVVHEASSMRIAWDDVARLPNDGLTARVIARAEDAAFEAALGLSAGELDGFRVGLGRPVFGVMREGAPVGVTAFDANFPGASPFRARSPAVARALLEGVRPRVLPGQSAIFAFVEGDPALETALVAIGAEAVLRALRMEGDVARDPSASANERADGHEGR